MATHRDREYGAAIFNSLKDIVADSHKNGAQPIEMDVYRGNELRKMKKFRFQLLHQWLIEHFEPCRVADIAGGKGMLAYLLQKSQWAGTVIDPVNQDLPHKYKDIIAGKRVFIDAADTVPRIDKEFEVVMAQEFDLLVGMHAHGCNAKIIDAATEYGCGFVLFPCCVIDEPFYPRLGIQWLECVADYAVFQGHTVYPFRLNFKGQNIGLCSVGRCRLKSE